MNHLTHPEPRPAPRQRVSGHPHVDVAHSAAAGQLVLTVHVDVPDGYIVPAHLKANVAEAVQAIAFPAPAEEEQES